MTFLHYMRSTTRASYDYLNRTGTERNLQSTKSTSLYLGFSSVRTLLMLPTDTFS